MTDREAKAAFEAMCKDVNKTLKAPAAQRVVKQLGKFIDRLNTTRKDRCKTSG